MIGPISWDEKVTEDYRQRAVVDADNPILVFKANRDRYTNLPNQSKYANELEIAQLQGLMIHFRDALRKEKACF